MGDDRRSGDVTKVYVGGLRPDATEREVEDEFGRFGRIYKIWIARKPPGFAFIDFEDYRDAEDAVRKLDGYQGWRVEISRSRGPAAPGGGGGGRGRGDMACFNCGEVGHLARDCRNARGGGGSRGGGGGGGGYGGGGGGGGYSPRRSSPRRRSYSPKRRSPSPAPRGGRSRSRSPPPARRSRSRS
ncbi:hypothetical protein FOA52_007034 [Chlamydomonas sp. UWO 241]|nr:hypothetical protein FOA52_007034 [Chlamydomonas sp. UWO 241]